MGGGVLLASTRLNKVGSLLLQKNTFGTYPEIFIYHERRVFYFKHVMFYHERSHSQGSFAGHERTFGTCSADEVIFLNLSICRTQKKIVILFIYFYFLKFILLFISSIIIEELP